MTTTIEEHPTHQSLDLSDSSEASRAVAIVPTRPRILGRFQGRVSAGDVMPTLICVAGLHGNEPAGVEALERVFAKLAVQTEQLRGAVVGLVGNRKALSVGRRYLEEDLNRQWVWPRIEEVRASQGVGLGAEEEEMLELDRELQQILTQAPGPVFAIDLHTTSAAGSSFVVLDDTLANRRFALDLPVPLVVGIEEELDGTLAHYLNDQQVTTIGFESGQHEEPESVDRAEAAIWLVLAGSGSLAKDAVPELAPALALLSAEGEKYPHVVEVEYRHPVAPADRFRMRPGFVNLCRVERGQLLAEDHAGEVVAPVSGLLLMPLYQEQGGDGFFLVREIQPTWLHISGMMRRMRLERWIHWLPGVRRHAEQPGSFVVDRRYARWLALEIFHLLGFRRRGDRDDRYLLMIPRSHR